MVLAIDLHNKEHDTCSSSISSGGGIPFTTTSALKDLQFLGKTINFID